MGFIPSVRVKIACTVPTEHVEDTGLYSIQPQSLRKKLLSLFATGLVYMKKKNSEKKLCLAVDEPMEYGILRHPQYILLKEKGSE